MTTDPRSPTLDFVAQDLRVFLTAVMVGGITAALVRLLLGALGPAEMASDVALACATTMTGAVHARLVHRQPLRSLAIAVLVGLPLVYVAMGVLHVALRAVS